MNLGIKIRSLIAYSSKYKRDLMLIAADLIFLMISLFIGTYIVFGEFMGFPPYAYPTVFIVPVIVLIVSMILSGEYFEESGSVAATFYGYAQSFLILSTLTYFFPDYRFSRGTLLSMIVLSIVFSAVFRVILNTFGKKKNIEKVNALFVGNPATFTQLLDDFRISNPLDIYLSGFVSDDVSSSETPPVPWLGKLRHLDSIIKEHKINNVIISDPKLSSEQIMGILSSSSIRDAKYHLAHRYEDFVASQLINNISFVGNSLPKYNIRMIRYRIIKRMFDLVFSIGLILSVYPLIVLKKHNIKLRDLLAVIFGKKSLIGIKNIEIQYQNLKDGLISLADMSSVQPLPERARNELNEYYMKNYSLSLDLEILLKYFFKNHNTTT